MTTTTEEEEDKAREEAEARRKKILEDADSRMSRVEGTNLDAAAKPPTAVNSRLAAMRKRRFKKKDDDKEAAAASSEEADVTKEETTTTAKKTHPAKVVAVKKEEVAEAARAISSEQADDAPKKKYVGVAKMRRRINKEKKQEHGQTEAVTIPTTTTIPKKKKKKVTGWTLPILMHAVTVLLLFIAGLEVGLQQGSIDYDPSLLQVHSEFAPRSLGGIHLLIEYASTDKSTDKHKTTEKQKPHVAEPEWQDAMREELEEDDEFANAYYDGESSELNDNNNMDPLFRVDLDKLTAGPGFLPWVARGAIRFHRINLAIFYYGPRRVLEWLLSFAQSPPILCILAILIRQVIAKGILGAKLPPKVEQQEHWDFMSMFKRFVSGVFLRNFPTAVTIYDVWNHLRSDMYIIVCGLFVGLALSHQQSAGSPYSPALPPIEHKLTDEL